MVFLLYAVSLAELLEFVLIAIQKSWPFGVLTRLRPLLGLSCLYGHHDRREETEEDIDERS